MDVTADSVRDAARRANDREQAIALGELLASAIEWRQQSAIANTHANDRHRKAIDRWLELAEPQVSAD
jgi:hypothetical protein